MELPTTGNHRTSLNYAWSCLNLQLQYFSQSFLNHVLNCCKGLIPLLEVLTSEFCLEIAFPLLIIISTKHTRAKPFQRTTMVLQASKSKSTNHRNSCWSCLLQIPDPGLWQKKPQETGTFLKGLRESSQTELLQMGGYLLEHIAHCWKKSWKYWW